MGIQASKESKQEVVNKGKEIVEKVALKLLDLKETCCVCITRPIRMMTWPCKHCCLCEEDGARFARGDRCPICKTEIERIMRVYF